MILLDDVAEALDAAGVPFALIGAAALAVHGVVRSTFDLDLLTTAPEVLNESFWSAVRVEANIDLRLGAEDDPFAGAVRFSAAGERDVDVMVGRRGWLDGAIARRISVPLAGRDLPVVGISDLILLKLYAAGTQDRWDIEQLLAVGPAASVREDVESRLTHLPHPAAALWHQLIAGEAVR